MWLAASTMGAAASLEAGAGSVLARLRGPKDDNSLDLDDDVTNPGDGELDLSNPTKVKKAYRKSQDELRAAKETLSTNNQRVQSLTTKLSEMLGALKVLKTENANLARDFEKAEEELGKMANPEREAYMHKYALGKLHEEFDRYKVEVAEQQHKEAQEMRRLQASSPGRSGTASEPRRLFVCAVPRPCACSQYGDQMLHLRLPEDVPARMSTGSEGTQRRF